jgi:hypothetical protein
MDHDHPTASSFATSAVWRARAVFVSSTFRDMQAERGWLRDHVIPVLAERLRERRHHREVIDLRWGVEAGSATDQEHKEPESDTTTSAESRLHRVRARQAGAVRQAVLTGVLR